ncbi:MAG: hypothetical protein C0501_19235 [Isosphaera sp.]|nr:hypothetical protein [Isosphaera sp.]
MGAAATAAPVPVHLMPKEPPLYFPTRVGAKWVYQWGERELTQSVTAVERTDAGSLVTVTGHRPDGTTFTDQKVLVRQAGLTQVESFLGKLASPRCWLKVPCVAGAEWEDDCSTDLVRQKWVRTAVGAEAVEVPAGKFTALRVRNVLVVDRRGLHLPVLDIGYDGWYAPGVGLVRSEERPGNAMVLKSFTR